MEKLTKQIKRKYKAMFLKNATILTVIYYLCFSFVLWNFNVYDWGGCARGSFIFILALTFTFLLAITEELSHKEIKKMKKTNRL
ncbi:hypothetical protein [Ornithobacterium rhinotracheale]